MAGLCNCKDQASERILIHLNWHEAVLSTENVVSEQHVAAKSIAYSVEQPKSIIQIEAVSLDSPDEFEYCTGKS